MQVEPRLFPVALNGALGHAANIADFGDRESAKILEIDEVREVGVDGGKLVERGIGPGGALAVNTSGGGLRYCHPGMFGIFLLIEAVRQLRAEAGERQVAKARRALVHGYGGIFAGNATVVLGRG